MNLLINTLIKKNLTFPALFTSKGDNKILARKLDATLMQAGFKLSHELLVYVSKLDFNDGANLASILIESAKELVGDHVKHNVYFIEFPKNVPDTVEFWTGLLIKYYQETGQLTNNLLDFPEYGNYQHSYEDMVKLHAKLKLSHPKYKVIHLGKTLEEELKNLYVTLASSRIPLNEEDRKLLETLFKDYAVGCPIPVRENLAIINGLRLRTDQQIQVNTLVDVLRLAVFLSDGDVTLVKKTKFTSFKRSVRRVLVAALSNILQDKNKLDDIVRYKEQFKRLFERLHPREFNYAHIKELGNFLDGNSAHKTWGHKVEIALSKKKIETAIDLLSEKPGYFVRRVDQLARNGTDEDNAYLVSQFKKASKHVSARVLLSLKQHLLNRSISSRIFVNREGKGYATPNTLETIKQTRITSLIKTIDSAIGDRLSTKDILVIDSALDTVALPLSEKTKAEGFDVLPRGSVFPIDSSKNILRFFVYWKQRTERTDYDLSVVFYDKDFQPLEHVSWTRLGWGDDNGYAVHGGDMTDATNGATEFIDVNLNKLPAEVVYIIPTVNYFTGEDFFRVEESFFGYMGREVKENGKPFEAATVQTKFAMRGEGKIASPFVFIRSKNGVVAKWMDLYYKGMPWGNRVETNKFSTALVAKSIVERNYLKCGDLLNLYAMKAKKVYKLGDKLPNKPVTYFGLRRPEGLDENSEVYTLSNLKEIIPA